MTPDRWIRAALSDLFPPSLTSASLVPGLLLALLLAPAPASAQGHDGFLLGEPRVRIGFHTGYAVPTASSEIFDFVRDELTVERSDFNAVPVGGELALRVSPRLDLRLDVSVAQSSVRSEFRDWVDLDDLPIEQVTRFQRVPATLGLRWYLKDRGRSIGRFAWIPSDWSPYLGAAGGVTWYRFEQEGDFVDFETLDIFFSDFVSEGTAATGQIFGGLDYTLAPNFLLTLEGRWNWAASVDMGGDFVGFEPMDLSGFQATVGFAARF